MPDQGSQTGETSQPASVAHSSSTPLGQPSVPVSSNGVSLPSAASSSANAWQGSFMGPFGAGLPPNYGMLPGPSAAAASSGFLSYFGGAPGPFSSNNLMQQQPQQQHFMCPPSTSSAHPFAGFTGPVAPSTPLGESKGQQGSDIFRLARAALDLVSLTQDPICGHLLYLWEV